MNKRLLIMQVKISENRFNKIIEESIKDTLSGLFGGPTMINESFSSSRIMQLVSQHGGIKEVNSPNVAFRTRIDLSKITDDMISNISVHNDENNVDKLRNFNNSVNSITKDYADMANGINIICNDGAYILISLKGNLNDMPKPSYANPNNRNGRFDRDGAVPHYSEKRLEYFRTHPEASADALRTNSKTWDAKKFRLNESILDKAIKKAIKDTLK